MHGAIIGDIWGSIFETIPKHPRRLFMSPTDDSFLTCACYEFVHSLSHEERQDPFNNFESIYNKAVISLKKWGKKFPEPGAYSTGFLNWAHEDGTQYKVASTNGCLMRQSPIALYSIINHLSLEQCIEISRIFCFPTHKSDEAFKAVKEHITILYLMLLKDLFKDNFIKDYDYLIKPAGYWIDLSQTVKNNFIWKASDSLGIALSAIYYTQSWEDMMRFFLLISGDVDTYAAIAGPIAQLSFFAPKELSTIVEVLKSSSDPRFEDILEIYNALNYDFKLISF